MSSDLTRVANPLTTSDLAPLRRVLGAHSMVVRVNDDNSLAPFEIMPELFLGRSIRQLLSEPTKTSFEQACRVAAATGEPHTFAPNLVDESDEVVITPVRDCDGGRVRFLLVWARRRNEGPYDAACDGEIAWSELSVDDVVVQFRASGPAQIEASPWWVVCDDEVALWTNHERLSDIGLAGTIMDLVVTEGIHAISVREDLHLRLEVPGADMLAGLLPTMHGALRAAAVGAERVTAAIPVELACDSDLLPVIVHLRTMGIAIDLVGLDALTARLHTVSDTADSALALAAPDRSTCHSAVGSWTVDSDEAGRDALATRKAG